MNPAEAACAIEAYFSSEAAEMYWVIGGAVLLFATAALLWLKLDDRFSVSLAISLSVVALMLAVTGVSLLVRDTANRNNLLSLVQQERTVEASAALEAEKRRMIEVVKNYSTYRFMFAAAALIGALLIAWAQGGLAHAAAVGLLAFSAAGVVIDQYSEKRATAYLERLEQAL
jgi:hypothetical protein